ncbi:protoporphyrinogen oxidase [Thermaerobacter marianensis]|nr:protoporphyrinogen oxidase [Thermaerobacter marianensis]
MAAATASGGAAPRVAVVGGGIAGLAAALRLLETARARGAPCDVQVIEADGRVGGKVRTERTGGFVIEQGPDSLVASKPHGIQLARHLGLDADLVAPGPAAGRTFIVWNGRLQPMPPGFALGVPVSARALWSSPLFGFAGKLRASLEPFIPPRRDGADEPVAAFLRRRLGREVTERLAAPLLAGVASGDPEVLSIQATFPQLVQLEREFGSLVRGMARQRRTGGANRTNRRSAVAAAATQPGERGAGGSPAAGVRTPFVTLRGGLGQLAAAAAQRIEALGGRIITGARITAIEPVSTPGTAGGAAGGPTGYRLTAADGSTQVVDGLVLAVPAWAAASLVEPFLPAVAERLAAIPYKPTAVVALAYPEERAGRLDGSGFIVPPGERRFITACTWVSSKWPGTAPPGMALLRAFGGRPGEDPLVLPDEELVARVRADLAELAGVEGEPALVRVYRWPRAIPQYPVGHLDRMAAVRAALQEHPRLVLAGAGYFGMGVPDCIRQGEAAAEALWAVLQG